MVEPIVAMRIGLVIALSAMIAACVPAPHVHYFAPSVSGVVLNGGEAVSNAEIVLSAWGTDEISSTRTDSSGRFQVAPLTEIRLWTYLGPADPGFEYTLRIETAGKRYAGWSEGRIGYVLDEDIHVTCELSNLDGNAPTQGYCDLNR